MKLSLCPTGQTGQSESPFQQRPNGEGPGVLSGTGVVPLGVLDGAEGEAPVPVFTLEFEEGDVIKNGSDDSPEVDAKTVGLE